MIRSLGLKLAMLVITMGVVFLIKWQPVEPQLQVQESIDSALLNKSLTIASAQPQSSPVRQSVESPIKVTRSESSPGGVTGSRASRLVDLNSATADDLESLPGIGTVLAQRVIDYRKSVGRFWAVEDLREVKGIGAKTFDRIKSLVTVARGELKGKTEKRPS